MARYDNEVHMQDIDSHRGFLFIYFFCELYCKLITLLVVSRVMVVL